MKKSFRIFSIILTVAVIMSAMIIPAYAAIPPQKYGDVNFSNSIDIMDATDVQRYIAKIDLRTIRIIESADVDGDAKITVIDATLIQRYVAKDITEFPAGKEFFIDKSLDGVTADYDNDKAIAGHPVTFSVDGYMYPSPTTAKLYINDQLVAQTQEENPETGLYDLTYTFEKAGAYRVDITFSDKWGSSFSWNRLYIVKEEPQDLSKPYIVSIARDKNYTPKPIFTVNVKFGTAPYQYKYTLYRFDEESYSTEFIDSNTFKSPFALENGTYIDDDGNYINANKIKVEVKDAAGKIAVDEYSFEIENKDPA